MPKIFSPRNIFNFHHVSYGNLSVRISILSETSSSHTVADTVLFVVGDNDSDGNPDGIPESVGARVTVGDSVEVINVVVPVLKVVGAEEGLCRLLRS